MSTKRQGTIETFVKRQPSAGAASSEDNNAKANKMRLPLAEICDQHATNASQRATKRRRLGSEELEGLEAELPCLLNRQLLSHVEVTSARITETESGSHSLMTPPESMTPSETSDHHRPRRGPRVSYAITPLSSESDADGDADELGISSSEMVEDSEYEAMKTPDSDGDYGEEEDLAEDSDMEEHMFRVEMEDAKLLDNDELMEDISDGDDQSTAAVPSAHKPKASKKSSVKARKQSSGLNRGIDLSLPPMSEIGEMFHDMTAKSLDIGLGDALRDLNNRTITVATMCSGTEAPLLALQLITKSLAILNAVSLRTRHLFSAEIEPFKQAYIERNFHPPVIFRDIKELLNKRTQISEATTAYGARVQVPGNVGILIAGPSCKDYSNLNNRKKKLDDGGESGNTFFAVLQYTRTWEPAIVIIENVLSAPWPDMKKHFEKIGYEATYVKLDTKKYYLPHTRLRGYMLCVNRSRHGHGVSKAVSQWPELMKCFERPASSPVESFMLSRYDNRVQRSAAELLRKSRDEVQAKEDKWEACRNRHMNYRAKHRLGFQRPYVRWNEGGSSKPPEYFDKVWLERQPDRVKDFLEISLLRNALPQRGSCDSQYKMRVWETSQNIDRFTDTAQPGISPCQTPTGNPFLTDRGTPLCGYETLYLQGIPIDEITFTTETDRQLQDLAGNAMSSTVIGAAILASLLVAYPALQDASQYVGPLEPDTGSRCATPTLHGEELLLESKLDFGLDNVIDIEQLLDDANRSSLCCYCEGLFDIAEKPILVCAACGHMACLKCGGNPAHHYDNKGILKTARLSPWKFENKWKSYFPPRLTLDNVSDIDKLRTLHDLAVDNDIWSDYEDAVMEAVEEEFFLHGFCRGRVWTIAYESSRARLQLRLSSAPEWQMFVKPDRSSSGNSNLRKAFEHPAARAPFSGVFSTADQGVWEWFLPYEQKFPIAIIGYGEKTPSWRANLGLEDYQDEEVWRRLRISVPESGSRILDEDVSGEYELLPECGTARASLHRRTLHSNASKASGGAMYFFLDPVRIGNPLDDYFVFSKDHERLELGESRRIIARIQPTWQLWNAAEFSSVECQVSGTWVRDTGSTRINATEFPVYVYKPSEKLYWNAMADMEDGQDCSRATAVLISRFSVASTINGNLSSFRDVDANDREFFGSFSWILDRIKDIPHLNSWHGVRGLDKIAGCQTCAPAAPQIKWRLQGKGQKASLKAYEDPRQAGEYERAMKSRPAVFTIGAGVDSGRTTHIKLGLNVRSLAHRALARSTNTQSTCTVEWRLDTQYMPQSLASFPPFHLRSNLHDEIYARPLNMKLDLRKEQKRSLTWMRGREDPLADNFVLEDIEEATLPLLGWRAEARVRKKVSVRGGVLADQTSYGKTVTTLALIHTEFEEQVSSPIANTPCESTASGLIHIAATLVVCPDHITLQWRSQIDKFLGHEKYGEADVIVIQSTANLAKRTIEDFQRAKIIIVSWKVFTMDGYISRIAQFAAIPEPKDNKSRAFIAWLDYALSQFPDHMELLKGTGVEAFRRRMEEKLRATSNNPDFDALVPSKRSAGKAHPQQHKGPNFVAKPKSEDRKASRKSSGCPLSTNWTHLTGPVLQLFKYNRLVIDEYTYLEGKNHASITRLQADKRWILSGTPQLNDFADVKRIAFFLGLNLGVDDIHPGVIAFETAKKIRSDMTDLEAFQSFNESRTLTWHKRRHQHAQEFLDHFVRQNDADVGDIECVESLKCVQLRSDHRAVYTELSQHLNNESMKLVKFTKTESDREKRLNDTLRGSSNAEEALLKSCSYIPHGSKDILKIRGEQYENLRDELGKLLIKAASLKKTCGNADSHFSNWTSAAPRPEVLGDPEAAATLDKLIQHAQQTAKGFKCTEDAKIEKARHLRQLVHELNALSRELVARVRSLRYLKAIRRVQHAFSVSSKQPGTKECDSTDCSTVPTDAASIAVLTMCGHLACHACLLRKRHKERCVVDNCHAPVNSSEVNTAKDFVSADDITDRTTYGKKLDDVMDLIESRPSKDQIILFVQGYELMTVVGEALHSRHIRHHAIQATSSKCAKMMEDFQNNTDPATRKKVLLLNLADESAAGVNLTNANHVIFLSPLLVETQYKYDASMTQAIGRARRYGQLKRVHIYRYVALRTIDVDILEQRERRCDPLWGHAPYEAEALSDASLTAEANCGISGASGDTARKERTKLVRNVEGRMVLVPRSWLSDPTKAAANGVEIGEQEDFSSLIKFSQAFMDKDYDD